MTIARLLLMVLALVLFALAAGGVVHSRFQLVPAGLAALTLAEVLRLFPP